MYPRTLFWVVTHGISWNTGIYFTWNTWNIWNIWNGNLQKDCFDSRLSTFLSPLGIAQPWLFWHRRMHQYVAAAQLSKGGPGVAYALLRVAQLSGDSAALDAGATLPGALDGTRGATGDGERRGRSAANGETLWEMEDSKWFHRKKHRDLLRHMGVEHDLTWFKPLKWGISGEETSRPWLFVALRPSGFSTHCGAVGTRPKRQPQAPRRWHFNAFYKVRKLESLHILGSNLSKKFNQFQDFLLCLVRLQVGTTWC